MPAVALTDHGSLAGAVELYRETRKQGVKPLIGCEVYVADDRTAQQKGYAHLTLLAESNEGYANLIKLCLRRLPRGLLLQAARRLGAARAPLRTASSRCRAASRGGSRRRSRRTGRRTPPPTSTGSCRSSARTRRTSRCRTPVSTRSSASTRCLPKLAEATRACRSSRPATSTTSTTRTPARTRRCSASSPATRSRTRTAGSSTPTSSSSRRPDEMALDFPEYPEAMRRTLEVAERCNVEIELGTILLPKFPVPGRPRRLRLPRRALREGPRRSATAASTPSSRSA